jgi:hypothetical protein
MQPIKHTSPYLEPQDLLRARDTIYLDDVRPKMIEIYHSGLDMGETTYFPAIDPHFRWMKGEVTLMGGIGNHGKSKLLKQMMLIKSVKEGVRWAVFSPEENPPFFFYADLCHTYLGKSVSRRYMNHASLEEYQEAMDFVKEHFFFIFPENDAPSPGYINERFLELIEKEGCTGTLTDPFNQLDNDFLTFNGRDDQYISKFLSLEKRFAMKENIYKVIIAHPNNSLKRQSDGNLPYPNIENFAGGALWSQKTDNILITHRPFYTTDYSNTLTEFRSVRIKKQQQNGTPGMVELYLNLATNRYESEGRSPFDHIHPITSNSDFFGTGTDLTPWK